MIDQPVLDAPVELRDLLPAADLDEVVRSFAALHRTAIAVLDRRGTAVASAGISAAEAASAAAAAVLGAGVTRQPLLHDGERIGTLLFVTPADCGATPAADLAAHLTAVLDVLLHTAYVRHLTAVTHLAAMDQAFSELTAKNQRLELAVNRLEEVDRLKSNFLATMSHELRTPLTSVIGYSEMLHEGLAGALNDEQREYVQTILSKADQLLQIITSILDVSLLESGQRQIEAGPISIVELVESVVATFASQARKRRIRLNVRLPDGGVSAMPPRALGESRKVRQVIWNLLSNAVKFTPEGGEVTVEVAVGPLGGQADGDRLGVRVVVSDSGIGIPPEKQAHIFEPFFQVDSSSTREYGGTGLGLTLAKSYAEAHGGRIWVDSAVGKGSTFTVSFPVAPEPADATDSAREGS